MRRPTQWSEWQDLLVVRRTIDFILAFYDDGTTLCTRVVYSINELFSHRFRN